jgi:hypothetical protein
LRTMSSVEDEEAAIESNSCKECRHAYRGREERAVLIAAGVFGLNLL